MTFKELERLADLAQEKTVLEVGAHLGLSTIALASTAEKVVSIDWHRGDEFTKGWGFTLGPYVNNLNRYGVLDKVSVVCADAMKIGVFRI
jgi:protein-L-isoaspartate O-methyltransferase